MDLSLLVLSFSLILTLCGRSLGFQCVPPARSERKPAAASSRASHGLGEQSSANSSSGVPTPRTAASSSPSVGLLLDPDSSESHRLIVDVLGLSDRQHRQLNDLSHLICEWNERINLVSRKDCNPAVVWTRHVLPSVAAYALGTEEKGKSERDPLRHHSSPANPLASARSVVDVGTGGGFPGLPLAIAYPEASFVLLDSVGKKLGAVRDVAHRLGLKNVETHHGRAEEYHPPLSGRFDVATGRSVSNLPQFCSWMHHLVGGHLMYWIGDAAAASTTDSSTGQSSGGGIPPSIAGECSRHVALEPLLHHAVRTDKRILVFERGAVRRLALQHNERGGLGGTLAAGASPPRGPAPRGDRSGPQQQPAPAPRRKQGRRPSSARADADPPLRAASRGSWQRPPRSRNRDGDRESSPPPDDSFRRYNSKQDGPS